METFYLEQADYRKEHQGLVKTTPFDSKTDMLSRVELLNLKCSDEPKTITSVFESFKVKKLLANQCFAS